MAEEKVTKKSNVVEVKGLEELINELRELKGELKRLADVIQGK